MVLGVQVIKLQCKIDISLNYQFLTGLPSVMVSYLVLLDNLLHEEYVVTWDGSQSQQMTFPSFSQKSRSFSFATLGSPWNLWTSLLMLASYQGPQAPKLVTGSAHRAATLSLFPWSWTPCYYSDASLAQSVTTVKAQGFCQKLQANGQPFSVGSPVFLKLW